MPFDEKTGLYNIVDRINAPTLAGRIAERPIPLQVAARIIEQVGQRLDDVHACGFVHGDVHPGSITFDAVDDAYISAGQGTEGEPDHRSDIYSLGITLYQMVVGSRSFEAHAPLELVNMHIGQPLLLPAERGKSVDFRIAQVILKATAHNPDARYQTCAELSKDLWDAVDAIEADKIRQIEQRLGGFTPTIDMSPIDGSDNLVVGFGSLDSLLSTLLIVLGTAAALTSIATFAILRYLHLQ